MDSEPSLKSPKTFHVKGSRKMRTLLSNILIKAISGLGVAALAAGQVGATAVSSHPNDPYFPQQWALHNDGTQTVMLSKDDLHTVLQKGKAGQDVGWLEARAEILRRATSPVTVAVIDSGIDPYHPDLQGRISADAWDFITNASLLKEGTLDPKQHVVTTPADDMGHGTHVSGIIAANADNGLGVAGVAPPSVKVLPLRILSNDFQDFKLSGKLISDYAADAINYAVAHHAQIINMSLGWPQVADTPNARQAVANAIQSGVLIVAAAGNDRKDEVTYPCAYDGVLCVGAITNTGAATPFSNYGGNVDILAPGDGIISTFPTQVESETLRIQGYDILSGTSQSSPYIAGIAAILKSAYPTITANEIKARLFASAAPLPSAGAGLYGLVNIGRALDATAAPTIVPDFRVLQEAVVDEQTLSTQGQILLQNLWKDATNVQAEILINGQTAGNGTVATLAENGKLSVNWQYHFASLDDNSELAMQIRVSADSVPMKTFSLTLPATRSTAKMGGRETVAIPAQALGAAAGPSPSRIGAQDGHLFSLMRAVDTYPLANGKPSYFQQISNDTSGTIVQVFDPSSTTNTTTLRSLKIPSVQTVAEVIRIDMSGQGKTGENRDWMFLGYWTEGTDTSKVYHLQFYFTDPALKPLWGAESAWQITFKATDPFGPLVLRAYASPGSWIRSGDRLLPSFVAQSTLPPTDNYNGLDARNKLTGMHLYYLLPEAGSGTLDIRAIDSATYLDAHGDFLIANLIPPSSADQAAGHLRLLAQTQASMSADVLLLDVKDVASPSLGATTGWDPLSAAGNPIAALPGGKTAFLSFFDSQNGSLSWATDQGEFLTRNEFEFSSLENPIHGLIGALDFASGTPGGVGDRYWFIQTGFDIVAYHQTAGASNATVETIPMDRDSSFPDEQSNVMFSAIEVGTTAKPAAGVYLDPTLVMGDHVAVALWASNGKFYKPLRYSLQVPSGCVQMDPVHLTSDPSSFALPIFCPGTGVETDLWLVRPNGG
jgi:subtilisin family serine protease